MTEAPNLVELEQLDDLGIAVSKATANLPS